METNGQIIGFGTIPNGSYSGTWSGYEARFRVGSKEVTAKTTIGIRGTAKCTVSVNGGKVKVTT